jgi:hypothetical protein
MKPCGWLLFMCCWAMLLSACQQGEQPAAVSLQSGNLILSMDHGGGGSAWGLASCDSCHALQTLHAQADMIREITRRKGYASCTGCHGDNGSGAARQCQLCHNHQDLPASPYLDGMHRHGFVKNATAALSDEQCVSCHRSSDMNGIFELTRDLTVFADQHGLQTPYSRLSDFCLRCHNRDHQQTDFPVIAEYNSALVASEEYYRHTDRHGLPDGSGQHSFGGLRSAYDYGTIVDCSDCHAMHGTANQALIIDNSLKGASRLDATLRTKPYVIATGAGNFSQLCVMCHRMGVELDDALVDTGNGLSGVHQVSGDCAECHRHGEAVQAGM